MNLSIDMIEKMIKANAGIPMMLGEPGSGKSAIAENIAERNGWQFIDLRLAQMDQSEVSGLCDRVEDFVRLRPQEWAVRANERPTLVFFDELNRASREVRNASLQIFNERRLGWNFKFNDTVYFLAAGNKGEEDGTDVEEFDDALKNRIIPIEINANDKSWIDQWLNWAKQHGVHKSIIKFIEKFPQFLFNKGNEGDKAFATARSWTYFSTLLTTNNIQNVEETLSYAQTYAPLYVGAATALKFIHHIEEEKAVSYKDILNNWNAVKNTVKDFTRDKLSEILDDLKKQDINKMTETQVNNIIDFCRGLDPDEVAGYIYGLTEESYVSGGGIEKNKNLRKFLIEFKDIALRLKEKKEDDEKEPEEKKKPGRPKKS